MRRFLPRLFSFAVYALLGAMLFVACTGLFWDGWQALLWIFGGPR